MKLSAKQSVALLILFLLALSVAFYHGTIRMFPVFVHAWTQSERYALALGFLNNGLDFFHPSTFNLQTINGITRVDFPLSEYIVAIIMKISGSIAPAIFRIYTLCVSITGLVYLYLLTKKVTASGIKSLLVVLFAFCSPLYVYYQAGFLPSVPAIAFIFIAYYYLYSYRQEQRRKFFYLSIAFFLLAALVRIPFLIFFIAAIINQCWLSLKRRKINGFEVAAVAGAFIFFVIYHRYNVHLGRIYGNSFLDTFLPARSWQEFKEIIDQIVHVWLLQYFTKAHYVLLALTVLFTAYCMFFRREMLQKNRNDWFQLFILFCGTGLYFLLMTRQFYDHDYYFLDSLFVPVVLLFLFSLNTVPLESKTLQTAGAIVCLPVAFFFYTDASTNQKERYTRFSWDRVEITRQNFTGTDKFLDSIGIPKDAKILVIDAYSTNIPLILMNRKGYTVYQTSRDDAFMPLVHYSWDYVAVEDVFLVSDVIRHYPVVTSMLERVGGNGKVSFYKRSEKKQSQSLKQFLNIKPDNTFYRLFFSTAADTNHVTARLDPATEYGITAAVKASELKTQGGLKVLVTGNFIANSDLKDIQLVASIAGQNEPAYYQSYAFSDYFKPSAAMQKMAFQFVLPEFASPDAELKIYLWNPAKGSLVYDNYEVVIYK